LNEEEVQEYLQDPVAALPPAVLKLLPNLKILLVPFLERPSGKATSADAIVSFSRPADQKYMRSVAFEDNGDLVIGFAIEELEVGDYHYEFYHRIARIVGEKISMEALADYFSLLRDELLAHVHGEVDDESWQAKQTLLQKSEPAKRHTKGFREYGRQSFIDTTTLFLHGLCCDIDVEPGPRQLPSRHLRRRLKALQAMFQPPSGYALFPEELDQPRPEKDRPPVASSEGERSSSIA
jgi:hypothetical protein